MFPNLALLERVQKHIFRIPNKRKESKRAEHYGCYLLCQKAGLRVSEAVNFDLSAKSRNGLYRIKSKGKKRLVYIPKQVINELKASNWQPNHTNRFNFYHFLRKAKRELSIPSNIELTPHTLRRAFATYHAENGLPLPLLSKLLGHSSVRTTALYWMNTYHPDDDDNNDANTILAGKNWLEQHEPDQPESELPAISEIPLYLDRINQLTTDLWIKQQIDQSLTNALSKKDQKIAELSSQLTQSEKQNTNLQNNLSDLSQQNTTLRQEKTQIQQDLAAAKETINQLTQELAAERKKWITTENNLNNLHQQLRNERETNANLSQKLQASEQIYSNLLNTYQITLKDKETAEKQLNLFTQTIKNATKQFKQWQKINYYQQLEKECSELKAQIVQPPPWKNN